MPNHPVFTNPTGIWSYDGPFQAHLTSDTDLAFLKPYTWMGVRVEGTIVTIGENSRNPGRIEQSMGGIQLYVGEQPLHFGYSYLIRLCRPAGQPIWQNRHLTDIVMQPVKERLPGQWPQFHYDGQQIVGEISRSGRWYQLKVGESVQFSRHGTFRFVRAFKKLAYLEVTLPRKGWNPTRASYRIKLPVGECLTVFHANYHLAKMRGRSLPLGFGYRPGDQPLSEAEITEMFQLLPPGPGLENKTRIALTSLPPREVREDLRGLRLAALHSQQIRKRVEAIKARTTDEAAQN